MHEPASMETINKWVEETSDDDMLLKLGRIHPTDYRAITSFLRDGNKMQAIKYLRFYALDKVEALDGALYFVKLIERFESL